MLLRVVLVLISLPLLIHGGEGLYVALTNREVEEISCDDYLDLGSGKAWLRISGCELDYLNVGYRDGAAGPLQRFLQGASPEISELLFPARRNGDDASEPARLVVSTRDPVVLAIAERVLSGNGSRDQESFLVTMLQVVTAMRASKEVDGTLRRPLEMLRTRGSIAALRAPLAEDFAVLDLHQRPGSLVPGAEVLGGLLALALAVRRRRRTVDAVAVAVRSGPQLMLLNLPQGATRGDIEHAPPLGSQNEVRSLIVMSMPGIEFDDEGRGTFTVRAGSVDFDLRTDDPVVTAVVTVRGNASPAVARLLDETGWQAFAPKTGVFVRVNDLRPGDQP